MDSIDNIIKYLTNIQIYITLGVSLIVIIFLVILIVQHRSIRKLKKQYRKMMRGVNNRNLEELVADYLDKVEFIDGKFQSLKDELNNQDNRIKGCIQKTSIIRYRAFEDVGSDLSFSIALLDRQNDGIMLTGIYGRSESTTYAKPIDKGISRYELSEEEKKVLKDAISK